LNFKTTESVFIDFERGDLTEPTILKVGANPMQAFLNVTKPTAPQ
tara:strand:- start:139 stop:273 length:135 start_codon:yes stop_codon:yes gene_type:complete